MIPPEEEDEALGGAIPEALDRAVGAVEGEVENLLGKTNHGNQRLIQRGISQADINQAMQSGTQKTQIGKYGTPQIVYSGINGLTVIVETSGRNAGSIITAYWNH